MTSIGDDNDELYWLQLLSDLGSNRVVETSNDYQYYSNQPSQPVDQYYYLDKFEPSTEVSSTNTLSNQTNTWLVGKEISSRNPNSFPNDNEQIRKSSSEENVNHEADHERRDIGENDSIENKVAMLKDEKSLMMRSIDQIWATEYPKALEMIRSEMVFHKLEYDLESVNENEDDTGFEIIDYNLAKPLPAGSSANDIFIIQVPNDSVLPNSLHFLHFQLSNTIGNLASYFPRFQYLRLYAPESIRNFLQIALVNLQTVKSNALLSSFLGLITESSLYVSNQAQSLIPLIQSMGSSPSSSHSRKAEEDKYVEKLTKTIGWENISLRYCMASISYKERQLLKETREDTKNIVTNLDQFRQQLQTFRSSPNHHSDGTSNKNEFIDENDARFYHFLSQISTENNPLLTIDENEALKHIFLKYFSAPKPFLSEPSCQECGLIFSTLSFSNQRYTCNYCGHSFCDNHVINRRKIIRYGIINPVRVCNACCYTLDEIHRREKLMWKDHRLMAYLNGELLHYSNVSDEQQLNPQSNNQLNLLIGKESFSFTYSVQIIKETMNLFQKNHFTGFSQILLKESLMESVEALKRIYESGGSPLSSHEVTACLYYKLVIDRELRGCNPDNEWHAHKRGQTNFFSSFLTDHAVESSTMNEKELYQLQLKQEQMKEKDISCAIKFAPVVLNIMNYETPEDMQRLAGLQGLELIFTNVHEKENYLPSCASTNKCFYGFFGVENQQLAPPELHHSTKVSGSASNSSSNSAQLKSSAVKEVILAIRSFSSFEEIFQQVNECSLAEIPDWVDGSEQNPSKKNFMLKCLSGELVTSEMIKENVKRFQPKPTATTTMNDEQGQQQERYVLENVLFLSLQLLSEIGPSLLRLSANQFHFTLIGHGYGGAVAAFTTFLLRNVVPSIDCVTYGTIPFCDPITSKLMNEFTLSIVLHDDLISRLTAANCAQFSNELNEFYHQIFRQPKQSWTSVLQKALTLLPTNSFPEKMIENNNPEESSKNENNLVKKPFDEDTARTEGNLISLEKSYKQKYSSSSSKLYLPGRILHIYFYRGQYLAAYVLPSFESLQKIEIQEHSLSDHKCSAIMNALLEIRLTNKSMASNSFLTAPPKWIGFDESVHCSCCKQRFSWYSSIFKDNEIYRQKFNCRHCGQLVCGECSKNQKMIMKYGMLFPRRICDRCHLSGEYAFT